MKKDKNYSLKIRLFIILAGLISISLIISTIMIYQDTKHEIEEVSDANLAKSAKVLLDIVRHEIVEHEKEDNFILDLGISEQEKHHEYEHKVHSQIWKKDILIHNSNAEFETHFPEKKGFVDIVRGKVLWRSFSFYDVESEITIQVMEQYSIRNELILHILGNLFIPLLLSFLPIALIIWFGIKTGLLPVDKILREITSRSPNNLALLTEDKNCPLEIVPLITSLNILLSRLGESLEYERRFTDHAAHELKTPLAAIKAQAQLIKKSSKNISGDVQEYLADLEQGIKRTSHMVEQLLFLSRLESKEKKDFKKINLQIMLEQIIADHFPNMEEKAIDLAIDLEKVQILGNKALINVMLNNLIDNAIKYTPRQGKIKISLKDNILKVSNNGTIADESRNKIFDRFYRAENNENIIGSGLGLAIVRKIVAFHKADLKLLSDKNYDVVMQISL